MMRMMIHGSGRPAQMPEIVDHIAGKGAGLCVLMLLWALKYRRQALTTNIK